MDDNYLDELDQWRNRVISGSAFQCVPIPFSASREWRFDDGFLKHRTGGFFSLVGLRSTARHPELDKRERVIIYQPQIAVNGYLVRRTGEQAQILCQGRVEPGNVNIMQLAPTVQSTEANIKRLHGGGAPPLVEWFVEDKGCRTIVDGLQSEEGSRYHGKYNRNVVLEIPPDADIELPAKFRWFGVDRLRHFVVASNVFNTDSRSVLACMDWGVLASGNGPFSGQPAGTFGHSLWLSYHARPKDEEISCLDLLVWLTRLRTGAALRTNFIRLDQVSGWVVEDSAIRETQRQLGFTVRQYRITAIGREVSGWDQPLIDSDGVGRIALICQHRGGMLRFLVKADYEVGYLEGVQLSSSLSVPPGEARDAHDSVQAVLLDSIAANSRATVHVYCRQSEEGGRFYQDENDYELVELDPSVYVPENDDYRWLTLAQMRQLILIPGVFTIEMRNAMTMLLAYH